jgi:hypothetical protein
MYLESGPAQRVQARRFDKAIQQSGSQELPSSIISHPDEENRAGISQA